MNLYLDTSAWAKVFVGEPGADVVDSLWNDADSVVCLTLGYLEVRSVIARRLKARPAARARALLDERWQQVEVMDVDDQRVVLACRMADAHGLRTLDALHLAAAIDTGRADLVLVSWDAELRRAAEAEGLAVAP